MIELPNAPGNAAITTERETGIQHIRGQNLDSVIYAQGYAHAQTRLWSMIKTRAIFSGRLAELFGADAVPLDEFARTLGYRRIAQETYKTLTAENKRLLQNYADGVNDFMSSIGMKSEGASAYAWPPEFYIPGLLKEVEPWTPVDSLANIVLVSFSLTWDWAQDF